MRIAVACDHGGLNLKNAIISHAKAAGHEVIDFGTDAYDSCDYPDYAHPAAKAVECGECDFGIGMCGSGEGISMTLNKHQEIRAALCWIPEIASLARRHNNSNFLTLPARFIDEDLARHIVDAFLEAEFEGGRHQRRIDKIPEQGCETECK